MKRLVWFWLILLLGWSSSQAQDFTIHERFGVVADLTLAYPTVDGLMFAPLFGVQLGAEVVLNEWQFGIRGTATNLLILFNLGLDLYARYTQPDGISLYLGFGHRWSIPILGLSSTILTDWHALFGVQLVGDFFIEMTPGFSSGTIYHYGGVPAPLNQTRTQPYTSSEYVTRFILILSIGWSWR